MSPPRGKGLIGALLEVAQASLRAVAILADREAEHDRRVAELLNAASCENARRRHLQRVVRSLRAVIAEAPPETWGSNWAGDPDVPGGVYSWNVQDEIIHQIDQDLARVMVITPENWDKEGT